MAIIQRTVAGAVCAAAMFSVTACGTSAPDTPEELAAAFTAITGDPYTGEQAEAIAGIMCSLDQMGAVSTGAIASEENIPLTDAEELVTLALDYGCGGGGQTQATEPEALAVGDTVELYVGSGGR